MTQFPHTPSASRVGMFESFITAHWFSADAKAIWSETQTLQSWLTVEAKLAQAQAELGVIPAEAAATISRHARAENFDLSRLARDIAFAQHPLVPVLHHLEEFCGDPAAGFIHWGATTQNIFDSASAVQMLQTHELILRDLDAAIESLCALALEHADTPMAGRTHGQHALPITLGFKLSGWIDELDRGRTRLDERIHSSFTVSMGGAVGTFAAMGKVGRAVEARLAELLGLEPTGLPLRSSYDRQADYLGSLMTLAGTAQKIGQAVIFLQRTEVDELSEAFHVGKVGSSTMAQKRNPTGAQLLVSLSRMLTARAPLALDAMVRMDEGDAASTNVTDTLLPEIAILAVSVAGALARLVEGLQANPQGLRRNLAMTKGLIASEAAMMRLTELVGRHHAHQLLYEAVHTSLTDHVPLLQAIERHPKLQGRDLPQGLADSLNPERYTGESAALTREIVARAQRAQR